MTSYCPTVGSMQGRRHGVDWVDMSTPLLPGVVPEIDANPVSFSREEADWGPVMALSWRLDPAGGSPRSPL